MRPSPPIHGSRAVPVSGGLVLCDGSVASKAVLAEGPGSQGIGRDDLIRSGGSLPRFLCLLTTGVIVMTRKTEQRTHPWAGQWRRCSEHRKSTLSWWRVCNVSSSGFDLVTGFGFSCGRDPCGSKASVANTASVSVMLACFKIGDLGSSVQLPGRRASYTLVSTAPPSSSEREPSAWNC